MTIFEVAERKVPLQESVLTVEFLNPASEECCAV